MHTDSHSQTETALHSFSAFSHQFCSGIYSYFWIKCSCLMQIQRRDLIDFYMSCFVFLFDRETRELRLDFTAPSFTVFLFFSSSQMFLFACSVIFVEYIARISQENIPYTRYKINSVLNLLLELCKRETTVR